MSAPDAFVEVAEARLVDLIGVDVRRGGLARALRRHVAGRVAALGLDGPNAYRALLSSVESDEARSLIDVVTVPHSWLFRDPDQLAAVERAIRAVRAARVRVLVAGCAGGEDAYTVAALALGVGKEPEVHAFDINAGAIERARRGVFGEFASREIPDSSRRYFRPHEAGGVAASEALRRVVRFERRSLVDAIPSPPGGGGWDVVVCRNVLIYFERARARDIATRLARSLSSDGALVLGASDLLIDAVAGLEPSPCDGRQVLVRSTRPGLDAPPARFSAFASESSGSSAVASEASSSPESSVDSALDALDRGDSDLANAFADEAVRGAPRDARAHLVSGLARFSAGRYDDAARRFESVSDLAAGAWVAYYHLGLCRERLGWFSEAREAFAMVATARGPGAELPGGASEVARALACARADLVRLALHRVAVIDRGGTSP